METYREEHERRLLQGVIGAFCLEMDAIPCSNDEIWLAFCSKASVETRTNMIEQKSPTRSNTQRVTFELQKHHEEFEVPLISRMHSP